jgi:hypothetical protein
MSFYLGIALVVGLLVGGDTSYLVSIVITLMVLAAAAAAVVWVRRLAVAVACVWPLVALYAAQLYFSGSFERSLPLAIGLAVSGVVLGAVLPRVGTALVAASVGTVLLLTGLPVSISFSLIVVVGVGSFVGQALVLHRLLRTEAGAERITPSGNRRLMLQFTETVRWGVAAVMALVLVVILFAPHFGPGTTSICRGGRPGSPSCPNGRACSAASCFRSLVAALHGLSASCELSKTTMSSKRCAAPPQSHPRPSSTSSR